MNGNIDIDIPMTEKKKRNKKRTSVLAIVQPVLNLVVKAIIK
jgi:hypothetical protein